MITRPLNSRHRLPIIRGRQYGLITAKTEMAKGLSFRRRRGDTTCYSSNNNTHYLYLSRDYRNGTTSYS